MLHKPRTPSKRITVYFYESQGPWQANIVIEDQDGYDLSNQDILDAVTDALLHSNMPDGSFPMGNSDTIQ